MQNAWNLYRQYRQPTGEQHDLLSFRREIVNSYIMQHRDRERAGMVPRGRFLPAERRISVDVRYDGYQHWPGRFQRNRRWAVCRKSTLKGCTKCDVGLHDHCFGEWHGLDQ